MSHSQSEATGRASANRKKARHSWDKKGDWAGSKDVRTCLHCGISAYKAGRIFKGWVVDGVTVEKMPECLGEGRCVSCVNWTRERHRTHEQGPIGECPLLDALACVVVSPSSTPRRFFTPDSFGCIHHELRGAS